MYFIGKIFYLIQNKKSRIHGMGAYAAEPIGAKRKIGSLGGQVISKKEVRKKVATKNSIAIVELWNGKAIDASGYSNQLKYINHSCLPNTYMRTINFHVEFYTLRCINKGEELTCNYGATHHEGTKKCNCGAVGCQGFI